MRFWTQMAVLVLLASPAISVRASGFDDKIPDQQSIDALQAKLTQAQPREQCFLYAELVHQMTEFSLHKYAQGDVENASAILKQIQELAHKIHMTAADDNKRLKNTEILLRHTAFRLTEMLHSSAFEDRPLVQETLARVSEAENETMLRVFRK